MELQLPTYKWCRQGRHCTVSQLIGRTKRISRGKWHVPPPGMRFFRQDQRDSVYMELQGFTLYIHTYTCLFRTGTTCLFPNCSTSTWFEFFSRDAFTAPEYSSTTFPPVVKEGRICSTGLVIAARIHNTLYLSVHGSRFMVYDVF